MTQSTLLAQSVVPLHKTCGENQVKASFHAIADAIHDVILEINSQKFMIRIKTGMQSLERFEVLAVQGCVDMWVKVMNMLRRIVSVLYFQG